MEALSTTSAVYFLGYSLPAADWHARYIFRCGFYNRQQTQVLSKWGDLAVGLTGLASPLLIQILLHFSESAQLRLCDVPREQR